MGPDPRAGHPGRKPRLSDAELVCLAVAQVLLGCHGEHRWLRFCYGRLGYLFPTCPTSPARLRSGRWQVRYYDRAGTRHTASRTFPSKADATRHLAQVEADLLRGVWTDPRLARITFGEWVQRWQQTAADLRPGTRPLYSYLLRRFLLPAFGTTPLGKLDTLTVRTWLGELHQAAEVTPTTIAKAYRLLRRILNVAVEAGSLPRNPAAIKGAGIERAAEMRHVSIPQLLALPRRSRRAIGR